MKIALWELHSASDVSALCACQHNPDGYLVTVTVGEAEPFGEHHSTEADALDEAAHLLGHFMLKGWTGVTYCDSRIALP